MSLLHHYYFIITSLLHITTSIIKYYYVLLRHYYVIIMSLLHIFTSIFTYYYVLLRHYYIVIAYYYHVKLVSQDVVLPITHTARTTSKSNLCSTAPSSPWSCQWAALWKLWASRSCTRPHPRPFCMWASPPMGGGAPRRALDAPVPPRELYSDHPTPAPQAHEHRVSTWAGTCSR